MDASGKDLFDDKFRGLETDFDAFIDACSYMNEVQNHWRGGELGQKVNSVLREGRTEDLLSIKDWVNRGFLGDLKSLLNQATFQMTLRLSNN